MLGGFLHLSANGRPKELAPILLAGLAGEMDDARARLGSRTCLCFSCPHFVFRESDGTCRALRHAQRVLLDALKFQQVVADSKINRLHTLGEFLRAIEGNAPDRRDNSPNERLIYLNGEAQKGIVFPSIALRFIGIVRSHNIGLCPFSALDNINVRSERQRTSYMAINQHGVDDRDCPVERGGKAAWPYLPPHGSICIFN